ncbi:hypothetical protein DMH08_39240 [Actinomadura sp. WAC 06369]|nr:hypothetical protein DMH08_39240 [Actinomadura sp. WAC 06369]
MVTGMEVALFPVARIFGGGLVFDAERVPDVLEARRAWAAGAPEEMTSAVSTLTYPDLPAMPPPLRGRQVAQVAVSYAGPAAEGSRLAEPLRALGPVLSDTLRELPFAESGTVFDEPAEPHAYRGRNVLVGDLDSGALAGLAKAAGPSAPVMTVAGVRHLGGALARGPQVPNAVGHRDAAFAVTVLSPVGPGEEDLAGAAHRDALAPFAGDALGCSLNFSFGPLDADEVRSAFAAADRGRLAALRARLDPHGLLRANHPVPPAG